MPHDNQVSSFYTCPCCKDDVPVVASFNYDPGFYRNSNGDGQPPSFECEVVTQISNCPKCGNSFTLMQEQEIEQQVEDHVFAWLTK